MADYVQESTSFLVVLLRPPRSLLRYQVTLQAPLRNIHKPNLSTKSFSTIVSRVLRKSYIL